MNEQRPVHEGFMDADMKRLWDLMDPRDLRDGGFMLYGGTALALYLDHRKSMDFDFFTAEAVSPDAIKRIAWFGKGREIVGQRGAVDVKWPGEDRNVMLNFVDVEFYFGIGPELPPSHAPNGVPVAKPTDIIVGKLGALKQRGAMRDYRDLVAVARAMPDELDYAVDRYLRHEKRLEDRRDLAKTVMRYSFNVEYELSADDLATIEEVAAKLDPEGERSRDRARRRRDPTLER